MKPTARTSKGARLTIRSEDGLKFVIENESDDFVVGDLLIGPVSPAAPRPHTWSFTAQMREVQHMPEGRLKVGPWRRAINSRNRRIRRKGEKRRAALIAHADAHPWLYWLGCSVSDEPAGCSIVTDP
jgi:hypothetical protein